VDADPHHGGSAVGGIDEPDLHVPPRRRHQGRLRQDLAQLRIGHQRGLPIGAADLDVGDDGVGSLDLDAAVADGLTQDDDLVAGVHRQLLGLAGSGAGDAEHQQPEPGVGELRADASPGSRGPDSRAGEGGSSRGGEDQLGEAGVPAGGGDDAGASDRPDGGRYVVVAQLQGHRNQGQ